MRPRRAARGFTLLELMVASIVSALTIGGAVSVFAAVHHSETRLSLDAADRAQSAAIVDTIAGMLERAVALDGRSAVTLRRARDGSRELFCVAATHSWAGASHEAVLLRWGGQGPSSPTWLRAFVVPMSGSAPLLPMREDESLRELCERQDAMLLGDAITSLRIEARRVDGDREWLETLDVPTTNMLIRVRCGVGGAVAERIVVLRPSILPGSREHEEATP